MCPHQQVLDELRTPTKERLGVAVLMDGGTASVYAPRAWDAFVEFADDASDALVSAKATA